MSNYDDYVRALIHQFWDYAEIELLVERGLLDAEERSSKRPPVFCKSVDSNNILMGPDVDDDTKNTIVSSLSINEKHRHFASMRSSQALAQSVFGNRWLIIWNLSGNSCGWQGNFEPSTDSDSSNHLISAMWQNALYELLLRVRHSDRNYASITHVIFAFSVVHDAANQSNGPPGNLLK